MKYLPTSSQLVVQSGKLWFQEMRLVQSQYPSSKVIYEPQQLIKLYGELLTSHQKTTGQLCRCRTYHANRRFWQYDFFLCAGAFLLPSKVSKVRYREYALCLLDHFPRVLFLVGRCRTAWLIFVVGIVPPKYDIWKWFNLHLLIAKLAWLSYKMALGLLRSSQMIPCLLTGALVTFQAWWTRWGRHRQTDPSVQSFPVFKHSRSAPGKSQPVTYGFFSQSSQGLGPVRSECD